ncbi:response regulator [Dyadobacter diqingensis]|uniref:response regulator n=1 Tax=Dyadobacter diqingensis TaxID=2938121 RepID=UPI0020C1AD5C|nr:response regulator [Dyadobacter diqingensis]
MSDKPILMADDDADDRFLVQAAFEDNNLSHSIVFFEDGEQLLNYLIPEEDNSAPNLILLDLNMPKRDGREVLKIIRTNDKWNDIPIIIFSTSNAPDDIVTAYQLGANCYIIKPSSYEELKDVMLSVHKFWL